MMEEKKLTDAEIRASMSSEQILLERKLTCEAINGAMAFGYQDTNAPPSDDHWLAPFWKIGRQQAELEARAALPSDAVQAPIQLSADVREYLQEGISNCSPGEVEGDHEFAQQLGALLNSIYAAPVAPAAAAPEDQQSIRSKSA